MLKNIKTLLCRLGWHCPSFERQQEKVGFHDKVSGLQVNHYICSCGRKWMCDLESPAIESDYKTRIDKWHEICPICKGTGNDYDAYAEQDFPCLNCKNGFIRKEVK